MVMNGKVIGGDFLNAAVMPATFGSDLVVQTGFKGRKLNAEQVAEWQDVSSTGDTSTVSAVGQAVAGAVLPSKIGKGAAAAVGATIDSKVKPARKIRVDWVDGKQSLIKLPDSMFTHIEVALRTRRAPDPEPTLAAPQAASPQAPSVTEQAISAVVGIASQFAPQQQGPAIVAAPPDIAEQLSKLASLRDAGILTEEEFSAKKAELLARM